MSGNESLDNTTAFAATDVPLSMAVVESERSPYDNATASGGTNEFATASGAADDLTNNHKSRNARKQTNLLYIRAWNVRTTNDSATSIRLERATAIICRELEKGNTGIFALDVQVSGTSKREIIQSSGVEVWTRQRGWALRGWALPSPIN